MRNVRKQLLLLGLASALVVSGSVGVARATFGPGEAFGFVWTEWGSAVAQETVDIVAKQGKGIATQRYIIPPGYSGLWPTNPAPHVVMHLDGSAVNTYENCGDEAKTWEKGKSYYRDGSMSTHGMRLENRSSDNAELMVAWVDINPADAHNTLPWGSDELVRGACAAPAPFKFHEYGRGPAWTDIPWSHEQGLWVIAMDFLVAPQWHFNWHTHPPTFITHLRGTMREYIGCPEIIDWAQDVTYLHSPNNFGRPQERAKNTDDSESAQFLVMFSKGPKDRQRGQIPVTFTGPPNECKTDGFTTNTN